LRTYGRTKARTLKPRQAALVDVLLPHLAVPAEGEIDVEALFGTEPPPPCGAGVGGGGRTIKRETAPSTKKEEPPDQQF
jgi:tRNA (guanine-N7-)-methyltransferase